MKSVNRILTALLIHHAATIFPAAAAEPAVRWGRTGLSVHMDAVPAPLAVEALARGTGARITGDWTSVPQISGHFDDRPLEEGLRRLFPRHSSVIRYSAGGSPLRIWVTPGTGQGAEDRLSPPPVFSREPRPAPPVAAMQASDAPPRLPDVVGFLLDSKALQRSAIRAPHVDDAVALEMLRSFAGADAPGLLDNVADDDRILPKLRRRADRLRRALDAPRTE